MLASATDRRRFLILVPAALLAVAALVAACGGDGGEGGPAGGETPADGHAIIDVSMGDNFFDPTDFNVKAGDEVTFRLSNDGVAIHNLRVAGPDGDYQTGDDVVSDPEAINANEDAVLNWTAPEDAGTLDFRCDFHPDVMIGTITVQ